MARPHRADSMELWAYSENSRSVSIIKEMANAVLYSVFALEKPFLKRKNKNKNSINICFFGP